VFSGNLSSLRNKDGAKVMVNTNFNGTDFECLTSEFTDEDLRLPYRKPTNPELNERGTYLDSESLHYSYCVFCNREYLYATHCNDCGRTLLLFKPFNYCEECGISFHGIFCEICGKMKMKELHVKEHGKNN